MKVIRAARLEDCFDGSQVYRYFFDQPWTAESISRLGGLGSLDYYADFPRPFFRVRGASGFQINGVEGDADCRLVLPRKGQGPILARVDGYFAQDECESRPQPGPELMMEYPDILENGVDEWVNYWQSTTSS